MCTFGRSIGGESPSLSEQSIISILARLKFHQINIDDTQSTQFFMKFKEMYNGLPVFSRYTSNDSDLLKQCFQWLGFELLKNGNVIEGHQHTNTKDPMEFNYKSYKINSAIFSLLNNDSLQSITNIDGDIGFTHFDTQHKEIEDFNKINFTEVSPFTFDGELTEIALAGSVYQIWKDNGLETKRMATEFVNEIVEGRFNDFKIYRTQECWRGYILGYFIAYFIFDSKKGDIWILSKDDYD